MARRARLVVPHYPHHVTQRGNRRQRVFFDENDYRAYLSLVREDCGAVGTAVLAYCLMPNHVHFLQVPRHEDGLRTAVTEAHQCYTRRVNFRGGWRGHLWQGGYRSVVVDESHLAAAVPYVECNQVRAGLCDRVEDWPWSSARERHGGSSEPVVDRELLGQLLPDFDQCAVALGEEAHDALSQHTRTGRPLGDERFIARREAMSGRSLRPRPSGLRPEEASERTGRHPI